MRKILALLLVVLMLATLVSCNNQPIPPNDDGTQTEQPDNNNPGGTNPGDTTPPGTNPGDTDIPQQPALKEDEIEKTTEHVVGNGKFVFYEHKYDYAGGQIVLMDVKNETDTDYSLTITSTYYDENGVELLTESKKISGFASGYQTPVLLWPQKAFATYSYTVEITPYDGVCWGENYNITYTGLKELHAEKKMLNATGKDTNLNTTPFMRCFTFILFDNKNNVYGIYSHGIEDLEQPYEDHNKSWLFTAYSTKDAELIWPEELTGELRCVCIPYFALTEVELYWNSDLNKFFPDVTPFDPTAQ